VEVDQVERVTNSFGFPFLVGIVAKYVKFKVVSTSEEVGMVKKS
jgi:hypothetical protein